MRLAVLSLLALAGAACAQQPQAMETSMMKLSSPDIAEGQTIPMRFVFTGCGGENVSPELKWEGAPEDTKSFALLVHDPDAPTGGAGFWHWAMINIPADATGLSGGAGTEDGAGLPDGVVQYRNDYGFAAWGGPCPPKGDAPHRYNFTLYALSTDKLEPGEGATTSVVGFMVNANTIAKASFQGLYGH